MTVAAGSQQVADSSQQSVRTFDRRSSQAEHEVLRHLDHLAPVCRLLIADRCLLCAEMMHRGSNIPSAR